MRVFRATTRPTGWKPHTRETAGDARGMLRQANDPAGDEHNHGREEYAKHDALVLRRTTKSLVETEYDNPSENGPPNRPQATDDASGQDVD
jgi:hypothetical protein